jgi:hypothetical protein
VEISHRRHFAHPRLIPRVSDLHPPPQDVPPVAKAKAATKQGGKGDTRGRGTDQAGGWTGLARVVRRGSDTGPTCERRVFHPISRPQDRSHLIGRDFQSSLPYGLAQLTHV